MIHSLVKELQHNSKNIVFSIIAICVIAGASYFPLTHLFGTLRIGGDMIIPLIPEYSYRNAFDWIDYSNGSYFSTDLFIWVSIFYVLNKITHSIYQTGFLFQFLIFFLSGIGIYKIFNLFNSKSKLWGILPAVAFILSPHRYDHMIYFYGTVASVWLIYYLVKFIKNRVFTYLDIIVMSLLVGFIGNLPNPKYHFAIFLIYAITIPLSVMTKLITFDDLKSNVKKCMLLILSTTYISLPFLFFGISFANDVTSSVPVTNASNLPIDYGIALISKMITLWHTPGLNAIDVIQMKSGIFLASYYILPLLILGLFPLLIAHLEGRQKKIFGIFYILSIVFIFLSKGSNPPFGSVYNWFVSHIKVLAFMRTTAGMVVYAGIFYALLLGVVCQVFVYRKRLFAVPILIGICLLILTAGYHIWSGTYFKNFSPINKWINKQEYGFIVPEEYFITSHMTASLKLDTKVRILPNVYGYQNNRWGYYGPIIYPWILGKPPLFIDDSMDNTAYSKEVTTRYLYYDKTLLDDKGRPRKVNPTIFKDTVKIYSTDVIDVYRKADSSFVPHFYLQDQAGPGIEYKRINPTKYRVILHKVKGSQQLVFSDNYHSGWKAFIVESSTPIVEQPSVYQSSYVVTQANISDQASLKEVQKYIADGLVTETIGDTGTSQFISKSFKNSIQNDNLPNGIFAEWLGKRQISDTNHKKKAGMLNQWNIDVTDICITEGICKKNQDNSYDVELIVEFMPQYLTYLGYVISAISILGMSLYAIILTTYKNNRHA